MTSIRSSRTEIPSPPIKYLINHIIMASRAAVANAAGPNWSRSRAGPGQYAGARKGGPKGEKLRKIVDDDQNWLAKMGVHLVTRLTIEVRPSACAPMVHRGVSRDAARAEANRVLAARP